ADTTGLGYYSLDLGSWHIVSLNSDIEMRLGRERDLAPEVSRQRAWLEADLAAALRQGTKCIIGIWHHPRFTGGRRGDNLPTAKLWELLSAAATPGPQRLFTSGCSNSRSARRNTHGSSFLCREIT
ncbi:MAG: hypothetical protein MUP61_07920, partial [Burkholderiales bacterium]|nr:hypothetical protein [Burkholderiales bacterium]